MHMEGVGTGGSGTGIDGSNAGQVAGRGAAARTQKENREEEKSSSLETLSRLAEMLAASTEAAIKQIDHINSDTQVLAMNALIEASRAGEAGKAFSVVAEEMERLSRKVVETTDSLRRESRGATAEMRNLIKIQATNIRGIRLSDLAMTNIDLVDRSLYERSCDVRWWARDASMVAALSSGTAEAARTAGARMAVILDSYTVYFDLVLCDAKGNVIANGRPDTFKSQGTNQADSEWFRSALACSGKESFGFQTVHRSPLAGGRHATVFSCPVRGDDSGSGKILGVLGTVFNWEGLAQEIVNKTPLSREDKAASRVCITDSAGTVLADTEGRILQDAIRFAGDKEVFAMKKGFAMKSYKDEDCCIAHAISTGYETYSSGWHSVIIQKLGKAAAAATATAAVSAH
jgi:hypothetical protein